MANIKKVTFIAVLSLLVIIGGATLALAQDDGPVRGVISACVNNSSGTIKINDNCNGNWSRLDWNAEGPQGPQGPTGLQGPQGPPGLLDLYYVSEPINIAANDVYRNNVECEGDDTVTGGGYFLNTAELSDAELDVEVFSNKPSTDFGEEYEGWDIGIRNMANVPRSGFAHAVCAGVTP